MELLTLGTIVRLKEGSQKIMIISRTPLFNNNGTIGYFDYGACLYPNGQVDQNTYFFNDEDIEEIYFKGYKDESEEKYVEMYNQTIGMIKYPKLKISDNFADADMAAQ